MKHLKMLGLAAVAACALMAFVGAGTASASAVLCENLSLNTGCAASTHVAKGSTLKFTLEPGTSAKLTGPFGETIATCTESTVEGKTTTTGGGAEAVKGELTTIDFGPFGDEPKCTVTPITSLGTLEVNNNGEVNSEGKALNGTVKGTGQTVTIHGTPLGTCNFATNNTTLGTLTGASNTATGVATFDIKASITAENCGNIVGTWSGSYVGTGTAEKVNVTAS